MNVVDMILKKQAGKAHTPSEIEHFIHGYTRGDVLDAEMSAWLMTVYFKGMNDEEIIALLKAMINSGKQMNFQHLPNFVADKHSTGGVGDKEISTAPEVTKNTKDSFGEIPYHLVLKSVLRILPFRVLYN